MDRVDDLSLDPQDWTAFKRLAHQALDDALEFVETVRDRKVWQPVPDTVKSGMAQPLPMEGTPLDSVYEEFKTSVLPYATGNIHPRFFGWVHGSGQAGSIIAETMAAAMNSNCGGRDHGAIYVERQVIDWCKELFQFPDDAGGLLVSGTSMANLIGIAVARYAVDRNIRASGACTEHDRLVVYGSAEVHESLVKAMELLGMGSSRLRKIAVLEDFTIDVNELRRTIGEDRANGLRPLCCVGCAGTVNTGAIDDLDELADICEQEQLWFHVDGAFGALCMTSTQLKSRLTGIERADSLAFDFHKWAHVQYDAACILVRDAELHRGCFTMRPPYLQHLRAGLGGGQDWPCEFGPELSRSFRALKIWFALKEHGINRLGLLIDQNCAQARYLAGRIALEPDLEVLAPVELNIVCFRCRRTGIDEAKLDRLNSDIVVDLQLSGVAAPSTSRIHGKLAIRVNITNHRTRIADLDVFLGALLETAKARLTGYLA